VTDDRFGLSCPGPGARPDRPCSPPLPGDRQNIMPLTSIAQIETV
jgi:hypothetical protein